MFDLLQIKTVPIGIVAKDLGFSLSHSGSGCCRLPGHDDKNPSFQIRSATNTFKCYSCGTRGSVIDLVMLMSGLDFPDACRWLQSKYLAGVPNRSLTTRRVIKAPYHRGVVEDDTSAKSDVSPNPDIYKWLLDQSPLRDSGSAYLASRCISRETQSRFQIGQIGDRNKLFEFAVRHWGLADLKKCGLIAEIVGNPTLVFPSNYIVFPFLNGSLTSFLQARSLGNPSRMRWVCPSKLLPPLYNTDALAGPANSVTICEGITDVLSAAELGTVAVGVLGAHARIDDRWLDQMRGKNISVIGDSDRAGKTFACRIESDLSQRDITVHKKALPAGIKDLNDYVVSKRRQAA